MASGYDLGSGGGGRLHRMARDLHDRVIQRIFAAGMTLQTAARLAATRQAAPVLGFTPAVGFDGPPGSIPDQVAEHVLAVCREALSNIARHADASAATVTLSTGPEAVLEVSDNGRGLGEPARASGLRNMRERAEMLGGTFQATSQPGAGTRLEWRVPLS